MTANSIGWMLVCLVYVDQLFLVGGKPYFDGLPPDILGRDVQATRNRQGVSVRDQGDSCLLYTSPSPRD